MTQKQTKEGRIGRDDPPRRSPSPDMNRRKGASPGAHHAPKPFDHLHNPRFPGPGSYYAVDENEGDPMHGTEEMQGSNEIFLGQDEEGRNVYGNLVVINGQQYVTDIRKEAVPPVQPRVHAPSVEIPPRQQGFLDELRENLIESGSAGSRRGELGFP